MGEEERVEESDVKFSLRRKEKWEKLFKVVGFFFIFITMFVCF